MRKVYAGCEGDSGLLSVPLVTASVMREAVSSFRLKMRIPRSTLAVASEMTTDKGERRPSEILLRQQGAC
jgi:hypothetical protein